MRTINYSDGSTVKDCVIAVWDDLHEERSGFYRAFWVSAADINGSGSPVIGYCSPGGSHKTICAVITELRKLGYTDDVYRNGRKIA